MTAASPLVVRVLGELELWRAERRLELPQSKKTRALLAYLVVSARPQRRDRLCDLLWDVADDPRGALRWSLSKLRPLVDESGARRLETGAGAVGFTRAGARIDLFDVREELARAAELSTARLVELAAEFRGPFLDGLELPDFLEFQSWSLGLREEARALHARLLATLVERLDAEPEAALPHARALAQLEPFDESAHAAVVRTLAASGREREAERHAQSAIRLVRQADPSAGGLVAAAAAAVRAAARPSSGRGSAEADRAALAAAPEVAASGRAALAAAPDVAAAERAAVPAAADVAAAEPAARAVSGPGAGPLVGRRSELERLTRLLADAEGDRRLRSVLLSGEPGIGKTRLVGELADAARRRGAVVLAGRAYEAEASRPYGPWIEALRELPATAFGDALRPDLAPLLPELGGAVDGERSRDRLFGAVVDLLAACAHGAPAVLISLDDVQWCDEASAELLHFVVRMSLHRPLVLVLAGRAGELADNEAMARALRGLRQHGRLEEAELAPLDEAATIDLVAGLVDPEQAARVYAESAGNPLFALEVARSGAHREGAMPSTLRRLVRDRLERLPVDAADVLRWAAVVGHTFAAHDLASLAPLAPERLVDALEALERFAMVRALPRDHRAAGSYTFAHDIVRQVVYAEISEPRRRLMHQRAMRALEGSDGSGGATAAQIAHHAAQAGDSAAAARAYLEAARDGLRLFAGGEADLLARRGMRHAEPLREPDRTRLLLELAEVRYAARRPRDPEAVARDLEGLARDALGFGASEHARLGFHLAAYLRWEGGDWSDAQRQMLRAEQVSRGSDGRERATALGEAARCLALLERDLGHAEALALEAEGLSRGLDAEPSAVAAAIGMLRLHEGRLEEAASRFARAIALCRREQDRLGEFRVLEHLVMLELQRGRAEDARDLTRTMLEIGDKLRDGSEAPCARALAAVVRYGDTAEAAGELDAALARLREVDAKQRLCFALLRAADVDLERGRADLARDRATEALALARILARPSDVALARVARARAALALGDGGAAEREREELRGEPTRGLSQQARAAVERLRRARQRSPRARGGVA